jgi:hypothetical protein
VINFEVNHMANNSAATPLQQARPAKRQAISADDAFIIDQGVDPDCMVDVMNSAISRSQAVLQLLIADLGDNNGSTHTPKTLLNALWLLQGQLDQIDQALVFAGRASA